MSLLVWLPLNGNLENQGISDASFSAYNSSSYLAVNASGKIGQCYERTAQNLGTGCYRSSETFNLDNDITMMCWAYVAVAEESANGLITNHSHSNNTGVGITVKRAGATDYRISCNTGTGTSRTYNTYYGTTNIYSKWAHLALTYSKANKQLLLYVDGVVDYTLNNYSNAARADYFDIFNWSTSYATNATYKPQSKLNDVRLYDECLSQKEISEIAKGLILHYPMNRIDGVIGGRNLIKRGLGDVKAGLFSNFSKVENGYAEHTLTSQKTYRSVNIANGFELGCRDYTVGSTVVFSYDIMFTQWDLPSGTNIGEWWFGQRYTNSSTASNDGSWWRAVTAHTLPKVGVNGVELNQWVHVDKIITIPAQAEASVGTTSAIQFYNRNADTAATITFRLKNVKLVYADSPQSWTPNPSDGVTCESDTTVYDGSGFSYNGTLTSTPAWTSDTVIGSGSYNFAGSKKVYTPTLPTSGLADSYTIAYWAKIPSHSMCWGFSNGNRLNGPYNGLYWNTGDGSSNPFYKPGTTTTISAPSTNVWHHYVITGDGTASKLYVDGVHYGTAKTYKPITGSKIYINGWDSGASYCFNGLLNDFRIYATALSATAVKELYQTRYAVADNGTLFCNELIEPSGVMGGRNLISDSSTRVENANYILGTALQWSDASMIEAGKRYTASFDGGWPSSSTSLTGFYMNINASGYPMCSNNFTRNATTGRWEATFTMPTLPTGSTGHFLYSYPLGTYETSWFENFKLEQGEVATPWSPAPEDTGAVVGITTTHNPEFNSNGNLVAGFVETDNHKLQMSNYQVMATNLIER